VDEVFSGLWVLNDGVGAAGTLETEGEPLESPLIQRLLRQLLGLILLTQRRSHPLTERLCARPLSPLRGINEQR
jgi:hypothetical protein